MAVWQHSTLFGCFRTAGIESEIHGVKVGGREDRAAELREEEEHAAGDYLSPKRTVGRPRWCGGLSEKPRGSYM